jgi:hypothetical protein
LGTPVLEYVNSFGNNFLERDQESQTGQVHYCKSWVTLAYNGSDYANSTKVVEFRME